MKLAEFYYTRESGWNNLETAQSIVTPHKKSVVFLFCSSSFISQSDLFIFKELFLKFPHSIFMGCSTAGEIYGKKISDESISAVAVTFEKTDVRLETHKIEDTKNSFEAGLHLSNALKGDKLKGIFVLSDGLLVNGSELVRGINQNISENIVVTGGLAGDGSSFQKTWVIGDRKIESGMVSALGFYGDHIQIGHGSKGGWDIFGPERLVTRSKDNILYELDNEPALTLYKKYLGNLANSLPASALLFPLSLRANENETKKLVRTILSVNEADQSMTFAGDITEGYKARFMRTNFDRLIDAAQDASSEAVITNTKSQSLILAVSCVGRRLILRERTDEEIEATLDVFPKGTVQIGFYSYGEISPDSKCGPCDLQNQTMTITTLQETGGS